MLGVLAEKSSGRPAERALAHIAECLRPLAVHHWTLSFLPATPDCDEPLQFRVDRAADELRDYGQRFPIVVRASDCAVVVGEAVVFAARRLGSPWVAAVFVDDQTAADLTAASGPAWSPWCEAYPHSLLSLAPLIVEQCGLAHRLHARLGAPSEPPLPPALFTGASHDHPPRQDLRPSFGPRQRPQARCPQSIGHR